jgi:TIR domain
VVVDPKIFITYSSKDEKVSRTICTALENRGLQCWISSRNVKPGQNFQEQIVKAIRAAKIMVLVFTANANNSNEIKKELALASQNNLIVIPVRIEDVTPNEAFAYEFATRQWIDLFGNWEISITRLVELIAASLDGPSFTGDAAAPSFGKTRPASFMQRPGPRWAMISSLAIVIAAAIAYEIATLSQQPPSVSATVTRDPPKQLEPPGPVVPPAPSQTAALAPQQQPQPPPVQAALPAPSEPVAQPQQIQPSVTSTAPSPSPPVVSVTPAVVQPATTQRPPPTAQPPQTAQSMINDAERAWVATKDTTSPAVLQAFINRFGKTIYGEMASARLEELKKSQIAVANSGQLQPERTSLVSGQYDVVASGYSSTFTLTVTGSTFSGSSKWECCPGPRIDPILQGRAQNGKISFVRDCSGQGYPGECRQEYTGSITASGASGQWTGTGAPFGQGSWTLRKR